VCVGVIICYIVEIGLGRSVCAHFYSKEEEGARYMRISGWEHVPREFIGTVINMSMPPMGGASILDLRLGGRAGPELMGLSMGDRHERDLR
jgi:hypothetical protein